MNFVGDCTFNKNRAPISILLYCDCPSLWPSFKSLYSSLLMDSRFKVDILAVPELLNGSFKNYDIIDFFDQEKIAYIKGYDTARQEYIPIDLSQYDYIFPNRPYDHLRPSQYKNEILSAKSRLCHITYGTCIFDGKILDIVCGFQHLHVYRLLFSETPIHTKIYSEKQQQYGYTQHTKILTVGSPKFDAVKNLPCLRKKDNYCQIVLYTPRWSLTDGTSSFLETYEYFFDLVAKHQNVKYIFRPHPLMESTFKNNIWKNREWDQFVHKFEEFENAEIDLQADYMNTFSQVDVLVSDMSSLLAEFLITGKPIIYMHKQYHFNEFGENISKGFYWCCNTEELDSVLSDLRNGIDPKQEQRKTIIKDFYYFNTTSSVEEIKQILLKDKEEKYVPSSFFKKFICYARKIFKRAIKNGTWRT